ncbi:MAG TPA: hypothetical protein GXZ39_01415 [Bacteroidales bacterium]|jgi:hypothetical protein|nr:hypothetical protein [Bacteroidales bacterium]
MKKRNVLMLTLALAAGSVSLMANTAKMNEEVVITAEQEVSKTTVEATDLPDAVKNALAATEFEGWAIAEAALIQDAQKSLYVIKLTKDEETQTVKFTPEGEKAN